MTVERIAQTVMFVKKADKRRLLGQLISCTRVGCGIVFPRTKHGANRLVKRRRWGLRRRRSMATEPSRNRAMNGFRSGEIPILVATDIASRGIDVDGVTHVFNVTSPMSHYESYVRIGRTTRLAKRGCDRLL